ncbi:unnamed protein product [Ranitomeya imitator]|uniref:Uncharacterized protein n=1 Tax=Ranitomeya imitator TaxID=111125 RepID=A0ABN9LF78_9NEOB|nr:unnamed protein product [Ranitomeya imitator]
MEDDVSPLREDWPCASPTHVAPLGVYGVRPAAMTTSAHRGKHLQEVVLDGQRLIGFCDSGAFLTLADPRVVRPEAIHRGTEIVIELAGGQSRTIPTATVDLNFGFGVRRSKNVYSSRFWGHVRGWRHYINDIFLVWDGDRDELELFFQYLNDLYPELGFTMDCSQTKMQFLDTCVYKSGGRLHTDLFVKGMDRNNILHYSSEHPRRIVESLPWSQLLRVPSHSGILIATTARFVTFQRYIRDVPAISLCLTCSCDQGPR